MNRMKRKFKHSLFALTLASGLACFAQPGKAQMVVTYQQAESIKDRRFDYDIAVLRLALEKTRHEYGDFRLQPSPPMNRARATADARSRAYPNFFVKLSYSDSLAGKGLAYARFPVDRGIADYRICFVRTELKARLAATRSLAELKRYSHGQGIGWADVDILRANGFTVQQVSDYESLFRMVAVGRFDLFCRGVNEILDEYRQHRDIPHLDYDSSFAARLSAATLPLHALRQQDRTRAGEPGSADRQSGTVRCKRCGSGSTSRA